METKKAKHLLDLKGNSKLVKKDDYRTPENAVIPILDFIDKNAYTILEPTDLNAEFKINKVFKENSFDVVCTGSSECVEKKKEDVLDYNFFDINSLDMLPKADKPYYLVTNPPFSLKDQFIKHCLKLVELKVIEGFALLMPVSAISGSARRSLYKLAEDFGLGMRFCPFDKRVDFLLDNKGLIGSGTWFDCAWFIFDKMTKGRELVFLELIKESKKGDN